MLPAGQLQQQWLQTRHHREAQRVAELAAAAIRAMETVVPRGNGLEK
jgi:hypothetical protein